MAVSVYKPRYLLQSLSLDDKLRNYYKDDITSLYTIESIDDYLARVTFDYRPAGTLVTILLPKEGTAPNFTYSIIEDLSTGLNDFDVKQYAFIGGLADANFIEVNSINSKIKIQYSVDGLTNWHYIPVDADFYGRFSRDNGVTWDAPFKYQGNPGKDGSSGGGILLAELYNIDAIGGILLCSKYSIT